MPAKIEFDVEAKKAQYEADVEETAKRYEQRAAETRKKGAGEHIDRMLKAIDFANRLGDAGFDVTMKEWGARECLLRLDTVKMTHRKLLKELQKIYKAVGPVAVKWKDVYDAKRRILRVRLWAKRFHDEMPDRVFQADAAREEIASNERRRAVWRDRTRSEVPARETRDPTASRIRFSLRKVGHCEQSNQRYRSVLAEVREDLGFRRCPRRARARALLSAGSRK